MRVASMSYFIAGIHNQKYADQGGNFLAITPADLVSEKAAGTALTSFFKRSPYYLHLMWCHRKPSFAISNASAIT